MYSFFRDIPIVGHVLKTIEILQAILTGLTCALGTLMKAKEKADSDGDGSIGKAIFTAIVATGSAITATIAAIGNPEPITKAGLIVTMVGSIGVALYEIKNVIETIEKNDREKKRLRNELDELSRNKRTIENLMNDFNRM